MMPAYLTALGTSSAATIPVTLRQTKKNGVSDAVASFTIPLCATIHLAGSTSKIFSFAFAIVLTQGLTVSSCSGWASSSCWALRWSPLPASRRRHYGCHRPAGLHAGLQRRSGCAMIATLHRPGLLQYRHQRDGRRRDRSSWTAWPTARSATRVTRRTLASWRLTVWPTWIASPSRALSAPRSWQSLPLVIAAKLSPGFQ